MDEEPAELMLSCPVCGNSATLTDVTPLRFEHSVAAWESVHRHPEAERRHWRASMERMHGYEEDDA